MKLLILHLSDIHFTDGENLILGRRQAIVAALRGFEQKFDLASF